MKAALLLCAIAGASASHYAAKLHCMNVILRPGTSGGPTAQIKGDLWKNALPKSMGPYANQRVKDTRLCITNKGQHCDHIDRVECKLNNGKWQIGSKNCAKVNALRYLVKTTRGPKIAITRDQLLAVQGQHHICYHLPEDNLFNANKCALRLNFVKADGKMWSWTVDGGAHNVPKVDGLLDSMVLVGKGCMAVRYSARNQKGTPSPMSEGYYAQPANAVRSVNVLAPRAIICGAGFMAVTSGKPKCVPCPAGTSSMPGDNICTPLKTCSAIKCYHVKEGVIFKKCDDSKYTHLEEGVKGLTYSYASRGRCHNARSEGFTHVFHHGKEQNGKHHICTTNKETGKCTCGCYNGALGDASRYCKPSFENPKACFFKKNGSITHCKGTTWFNEKTQKCEDCPAYATCKNGVVTMQTVRTTAWRSAKDHRTFHIPKQMGYDRCKISVKARQTDYGNNGVNRPSWNERLIIKHKDVNVKLHQNCGFKHQCYNDLYTCKLDKSEEMVTIDHGEPDWITIEGENGQGTDYCPFNPLKDLSGKVDFANGFYGIEHVAESSQTSGACRKFERSSNCYHMWAQVSIDCCCKGKSCTC